MSLSIQPRISIIVLSVNTDPHALSAIASIKGDRVEKILVNSGTGSFKGHPSLKDVILIEDPVKKLPGATRNIGIRCANGPIISFLASDCLLADNHVEQRLKAHDEGYDLVSCALRPHSNTIAAWASYIYIHKNRMPEFQKGSASFFGVSYRRDVFETLGHFNETMRIAEDANFNSRCQALKRSLRPDVLMYHRYPESLRDAIDDISKRAVREMRFKNRSGFRQARSELLKSIRLSLRMLISPSAPLRARLAASYLPLLGVSAAYACLKHHTLSHDASSGQVS